MLLESRVARVLPSVAAVAAAAAAAESARVLERDCLATRHEKTLYPPSTIPAILIPGSLF